MADRWGVRVQLGQKRVLHPGKLRWLRATAWMVLLFVVCAVCGYGLIGALFLVLPDEGPAVLLTNTAGALVCAGLYAAFVWFGEKRKPSELSLKPALAETVSGLVIGLVMFSLVMGMMIGCRFYYIGWSGVAPAWTPAALSIQSGVMEEVLMRAILMRLLWRAFGPGVAITASSAVFGLLHLTNPNATAFAALCITIEAGVMLGAFYALTGRLWVSIGVHAAWNFAQGYLFGAAVSGTYFGGSLAISVPRTDLPSWLTGGRFGPEASLPALLVGLTVGVAVLLLAWKKERFRRFRLD